MAADPPRELAYRAPPEGGDRRDLRRGDPGLDGCAEGVNTPGAPPRSTAAAGSTGSPALVRDGRSAKRVLRMESPASVLDGGMGLNLLSPHAVRFRGPALDRRARGALSAAGASITERQQKADWGNQVLEYVVVVSARSDQDALRRIQQALESHGFFTGFAAA